MKQFLIFTILLCIAIFELSAQCVDSRFKGISIYSGSSFTGIETKCEVRNNTYSFPNGIGSVKVYGNWKLEPSQGTVYIDENDSNYNGSAASSYTLKKTDYKNIVAIVYTQPNFNGEAIFLETGTTNFHTPHASIKTCIQAAKLLYVGTTRFSKCVKGENPVLDHNITSVNLSLRNLKCASVGSPLR